MRKFMLIVRGYIIPLVILAIFPLLDLVQRLESRLYGQLSIDKVVVDLTHRQWEESGNENDSYSEDESFSAPRAMDSTELLIFGEAQRLFSVHKYAESAQQWKLLDSLLGGRSDIVGSRAVCYSQMKQYEKADSLFDIAIQMDSTNARVWYNRGRNALRKRQTPKAIHYYQMAVALDESFASAWYGLARIATKQKRGEIALEYIDRAQAIGYSKERIAHLRGQILLIVKDTVGAEEEFHKAIKYNPGTVRSRLELGLLLLESGKQKEGLEIFDELSRIAPQNSSVQLALTRYWLGQKKYIRASQHLATLKEKFPGNLDVLYEEAKLLGLQGRDRDALNLYKEISRMDGDNPRAFYNMAVNFMDLGKEKAAVDAYQTALKLDKNYWQALYNLGVYYSKKEKYDKAYSYFLKTIEQNTGYASAHYNLGLIAQRREDYADARQRYNSVLERDESHAEARYNLGLIELRSKEYEKAEMQFDTLLSLWPEHEKAVFNLGVIARRNGNLQKADTLFQKAVSLAGAYPIARYNRGLCLRDMGDTAAAMEAFQHAVKEDSTYFKAQQKVIELYVEMAHKDSAVIELQRLEKMISSDEDKLVVADLAVALNQPEMEFSILRNLSSEMRTGEVISRLVVLADQLKETEILRKEIKGVRSDSLSKDALLISAEVLRKHDELKQASIYLQKYLSHEPRDLRVRTELASLYEQRELYTRSAREYRKLSRLKPTNIEYHISAGFQSLKADDYTKALESLRAASQLDSTSWKVNYFMPLVFDRMGEYDSAFVYWTAFQKHHPQDSRGPFQLGQNAIARGRFTDAILYLDKAVEMGESGMVQYYKALAYRKLNLWDRASDALTEYLKKNPDSPRAKKLAKEIRKEGK